MSYCTHCRLLQHILIFCSSATLRNFLNKGEIDLREWEMLNGVGRGKLDNGIGVCHVSALKWANSYWNLWHKTKIEQPITYWNMIKIWKDYFEEYAKGLARYDTGSNHVVRVSLCSLKGLALNYWTSAHSSETKQNFKRVFRKMLWTLFLFLWLPLHVAMICAIGTGMCVVRCKNTAEPCQVLGVLLHVVGEQWSPTHCGWKSFSFF